MNTVVSIENCRFLWYNMPIHSESTKRRQILQCVDRFSIAFYGQKWYNRVKDFTTWRCVWITKKLAREYQN